MNMLGWAFPRTKILLPFPYILIHTFDSVAIMGELVPENSESKTIPVQAPIKPGLPDIDEEQVRVATRSWKKLFVFARFCFQNVNNYNPKHSRFFNKFSWLLFRKALRRELHAFGSFILLKNILSARFFKKINLTYVSMSQFLMVARELLGNSYKVFL